MPEPYDKGPLARFTAALAERLRACRSIDDLCQMAGTFCHELLPNDAIIVSLMDPEREVITIRNVYGFGKLADRTIRLLQTDPRRTAFDPAEMTPEDAKRYCSGRMERVPDGFYELLLRRIPRALCTATQRLLGVQDCYVVGFALEGVPHGGLTILRRSDSVPADAPLLELLGGMVSLAIRQRRT